MRYFHLPTFFLVLSCGCSAIGIYAFVGLDADPVDPVTAVVIVLLLAGGIGFANLSERSKRW